MDSSYTRLAAACLLGVGVALVVGPMLGFSTGSILYAVLFGASSAPKTISKTKRPLTLIEKESISHNVRRFRFGLPSEKHVLGLPPGKHVQVSATINGEKVVRPYTPVTSDDLHFGYVDLIVKIYKAGVHPKFPNGGKMSQHLDALAIGDTLDFAGPSGHVTYYGKGRFLLTEGYGKKAKETYRTAKSIGMISGGTGITPMLAVIRFMLRETDDTKISLLFANQTEDDILCRAELEEVAKDPRVHLWYTLDHAPSTWEYSSGFINEEMIKEHLPAPGPDTQIFMCGPPPMIKYACKPNLEKLGFTPSMLVTF